MNSIDTPTRTPLVSARRGTAGAVPRLLRHALEGTAAVLIVAEIAILLSGVVSRYVFHSPIGWTDELAGVLFLWIGLLGAAIAFDRSAHMRLTFVLDRLSPDRRALADTFGDVAALVFLVALLGPALNFTTHEH